MYGNYQYNANAERILMRNYKIKVYFIWTLLAILGLTIVFFTGKWILEIF